MNAAYRGRRLLILLLALPLAALAFKDIHVVALFKDRVVVEIDGQVVGELKRFGNATRTSFAVKDGRHTVKVIHPEFACRPATFNSGAGAHTVHLILDFVPSSSTDGAPMIGFNY